MTAAKMPWNEIKSYYAKHGTDGDRYFIDWLSYFSKIEWNAWQDIGGRPFFPQWPVGGVFVDFAMPDHKVAVELDGKAYHDAEKDSERDRKLAKLGWTTYRIPGRESFNTVYFGDLYAKAYDLPLRDARKLFSDWFYSGSPAVFRSLAWRYLGEDLPDVPCDHGQDVFGVKDMAFNCLASHLAPACRAGL